MWLHSSIIKKGQHRKLYHPWTGPYEVLKKISEVTYRIKQVEGRRQCRIVHFDRLKPCPSNIRLKNTPLVTADSQEEMLEQLAGPAEGSQHPIPNFGNNLQLVDNDDFDQQIMIDDHETQNNQLMCYSQYHLEDIQRDNDNHLLGIMILYNIEITSQEILEEGGWCSNV